MSEPCKCTKSARWVKGYDAGFEVGRQVAKYRERAAIVAWLRSEACFTWLLHNTGGFTRDQASNLAAAIDQSEHLRGDE